MIPSVRLGDRLQFTYLGAVQLVAGASTSAPLIFLLIQNIMEWNPGWIVVYSVLGAVALFLPGYIISTIVNRFQNQIAAMRSLPGRILPWRN